MSRETPYLFDGHSTHALVDMFSKKAMEEVRGYDENTILNTPVEDLIEALVEKYKPDVPTISTEDAYVSERENKREEHWSDDYGWGRGGSRTVTENLVTFHVPFTGDANLFTFSPSSRSIPGPQASVYGRELLITMVADRNTPEKMKADFNETIVSINQHLATMRNDFRHVAAHFEGPARQYLEQRRATILQNKNTVSALGFPMKRRESAPTTYRAPEVRRKVTPVRPATTAPYKPEPSLDEAEYKHILGIMDNMTKVMERSPHTFAKMGEEDIRQHFLVQLNGQYEGNATGETFNAAGKTDILIRSEGQNIFIAECKFWHGEKGFVETVDQLLSYVTWRDTKTAVVIFNRNKNLSGVIEAIKKAMGSYPHKKRGPTVESDTRLRYVLGHPNDQNRDVIVTVMVYDIPST